MQPLKSCIECTPAHFVAKKSITFEQAHCDRYPPINIHDQLHRRTVDRGCIDNRELVVLTFPGPDRSIRLADLQAGRAVSRRYRNRRIGEFLKELDLTEGRSTGIPKILRVMRANGSPEPVFETDEERSYFLVRLPVHEGFAAAEQVTTEVTTEVERLLVTLEGEMSRADLMTALGLKNAEHFRKAYLTPALEQKVIERTIPDKPRSRLQKYRLTHTGKQLLAARNKHS